jgi:hypothetical protein
LGGVTSGGSVTPRVRLAEEPGEEVHGGPEGRLLAGQDGQQQRGRQKRTKHEPTAERDLVLFILD